MGVITTTLQSELSALLTPPLAPDQAQSVAAKLAGQPAFMLGARPTTPSELREQTTALEEAFTDVVAPHLRDTEVAAGTVKRTFLREARRELAADVEGEATEYRDPLPGDAASRAELLATADGPLTKHLANTIADQALVTGEVPADPALVEELVAVLTGDDADPVRGAAARALADLSRENASWGFDYPETVPTLAAAESGHIRRELLFVNYRMVDCCDATVDDLEAPKRAAMFRMVATAATCLDSGDWTVAQRSASIIDLASQRDCRYVRNVVGTLHQLQNTPNPVVGERIDAVISRLKEANSRSLEELIDYQITDDDPDRPELGGSPVEDRKYGESSLGHL